MPQISYKIKEYLNQIFIVIVPDNYTRAMLFIRVQEFYESKNKKFKNKKFSFWDYKRWYSKRNNDIFTYTSDWSGFNIPLEVALKCKEINKIETPYDKEMNKILRIIQNNAKEKSYIIGVESINSETFRHEVSHALYYTNKKYRKKMNEAIKFLSNKDFKSIKNHLINLGYCNKVINDEIQAYLSTDKRNGLAKKTKIKMTPIKKFKKIFKKEFGILMNYINKMEFK